MDNITINYLLVGFLGVLIHCFLKANSLNQDARVANLKFNFWTDYIQKDAFAILVSFLMVFLWLFLFKEVAAKYKSLQDFALTSFGVMGAMGSYIAQLALSRAKKQIRQVIDLKTNIADKVKPAVTPDNKEGLQVIRESNDPE